MPGCSNNSALGWAGRVPILSKVPATRICKELRFDAADGVWRVAFALDPKRKAVLLVAGDKSGVSEKRFYRQLIAKADQRFDVHRSRTKRERK
jgi:hypothetical protein